MRLVVIPRWSGTPRSDFYPWLVEELARDGPFREVVIPEMPEPEEPRLSTWPAAVLSALGTDPELLSQTVLAGHSVGAQAALHAVASLPAGTRLRALVALAGWWTVDEPWPSIRPWIEGTADDAAVRARAETVHLLLSKNDPFTADYKANAAEWTRRLNAQVHWDPAGRHFNAAREPAVLDLLRRLGRA